MKKQWLMSLAISLGVIGSNVFGQYSGAQPGNQYSGSQFSGYQYPGYQHNGQYQVTPYPGFGPTGSQGFGPTGSQHSNVPSTDSEYADAQFGGNHSASGENIYGASSYPVATQSILQNVPQVPTTFNPNSIVGGQVSPYASQPTLAQGYPNANPPTGSYRLVTAQDQAYAQSGLEAVPSAAAQYQNLQNQGPQYPNMPYSGPADSLQQPLMNQNVAPVAPAAPYSPGCTSCAPPKYSYFAPNAAPNFPGGIAPNCASCGPAPLSHAYAQPAHRSFLCGLPACAKPWYFGASFLWFDRVDCDDTPLAFMDSSYTADTLSTGDARIQSAAGIEIRAGRYFNCGRNAIEFSYWGIYPESETATRARTMPGDYRSRIPFTYLTMPGTPSAPMTPYSVYDWYDNAYTHSLTRSSEFYSFGVNLVGFGAGCAAKNFNKPSKCLFGGHGCGSCGGSGCSDCAGACAPSCNTCAPTKLCTGPCCLTPPQCGSRLNLTWLAGFRYFVFNDNLLFAASLDDSTVDRAPDDLYYEACTTNELAGFQAGGRFDYCIHRRINLYGSTNVGIYNNHSTLYTMIGTDYDHAYLDDTRMPSNPNNGQNYVFSEMDDQVAFLSELGAGIGVRLGCCWTANFGYRALIASGVATAPGNVRTSFANYTDVRDFNNCSTLILHGFDVGATYNF